MLVKVVFSVSYGSLVGMVSSHSNFSLFASTGVSDYQQSEPQAVLLGQRTLALLNIEGKGEYDVPIEVAYFTQSGKACWEILSGGKLLVAGVSNPITDFLPLLEAPASGLFFLPGVQPTTEQTDALISIGVKNLQVAIPTPCTRGLHKRLTKAGYGREFTCEMVTSLGKDLYGQEVAYDKVQNLVKRRVFAFKQWLRNTGSNPEFKCVAIHALLWLYRVKGTPLNQLQLLALIPGGGRGVGRSFGLLSEFVESHPDPDLAKEMLISVCQFLHGSSSAERLAVLFTQSAPISTKTLTSPEKLGTVGVDKPKPKLKKGVNVVSG